MTTSVRPIVLNLSEKSYEYFRQKAEENQHSIETEVAEFVNSRVPDEDGLPPDVVQTLSQLEFLDDKALEKLANNPMPKKNYKKIEFLHLKRGSIGLDNAETKLLADLMRQYDKALLVRAYSIENLRLRGHDIARFIS